MGRNNQPGWGDDTCTELDIFEANNHAWQSAIHTETHGGYGSGNCDAAGCFSRVGGPRAPKDVMKIYGKGMNIDTDKPFDVKVSVDYGGAMKIMLQQNGESVTAFDHRKAGAAALCPHIGYAAARSSFSV
jgi:hypothetical protein